MDVSFWFYKSNIYVQPFQQLKETIKAVQQTKFQSISYQSKYPAVQATLSYSFFIPIHANKISFHVQVSLLYLLFFSISLFITFILLKGWYDKTFLEVLHFQ